MIATTTFPFMESAVRTSHVEENLCAAFALRFQEQTRRGPNLTNDPFLHVLFRSGIDHYASLPSIEDWHISERDFFFLI